MNSQTKIQNAFCDIINQYKAEESDKKITISTIVRQADVNRKTFYKYYASTEALQLAMIKEILSPIKSNGQKIAMTRQCNGDAEELITPDFIIPALQIISDNRETLKSLYHLGQRQSLLLKSIEDYLINDWFESWQLDFRLLDGCDNNSKHCMQMKLLTVDTEEILFTTFFKEIFILWLSYDGLVSVDEFYTLLKNMYTKSFSQWLS